MSVATMERDDRRFLMVFGEVEDWVPLNQAAEVHASAQAKVGGFVLHAVGPAREIRPDELTAITGEGTTIQTI